jgi:protein SCO1/2
MKRMLFALLLGLSAPSFAIATGAAPLPPQSVLQQQGAFTDQDGRNFHLADRRGHVQIVSMFYSSCTYTCPLMVDSALGVEHALQPNQRNALRVLLVSFDPQRDTAAVLAALASKRHLDTSRWTLARADDDSVRKLAALLGVRYRKLASGDFNHTTGLILLDADGRILAKTDQLGAMPDPAFLAAVRTALDKPDERTAR